MLAAAAAIVALSGAPFQEGALPQGPAKVEIELSGTKLEVFTYKPASYSGEKMIMVFHGVLRNADEYRDHSKGMGDRFGALIVAPKFDAERFPSIKYQRGGILKPDGSAAPPEEWTYALIPKLFEAVKAREGKPNLKYWIIGHSAGGQFVARMAAFQDTGAERLVAANPSSWPFPTRVLDYAYGFGGLPESLSNDDMIRKYLARPMTVYLGTADNTPDDNTDMSDGALVEGPARYQRGLAFFQFAKTIASRKGWAFNWNLAEAEGVNHDHGKMFDHPACEKALFGAGSP
jgi:poly(3-hydroxybutyrate) depolymerase